MVVFRRAIVIFVTGTMSYAGATVAQTVAGDPPGRVGRLAFVQGTVSFHDDAQTDWAPALVNTPVTSGDAIWTEPNARSEISIAGTRLRMDSTSQLDMLALDDTQTRMQLDQGRLDIKTFAYDTKQPYEIVTPRGTISLQQQGDYYVEAGTTEDPTRLGVRQGAAQIQAPNGQVLAVRAGEVGEISGDGSAPQLHTIQIAPPPMPASWADRDRQVVYDKPPQYLGTGVTGYEDLNAYGSWSNDPEYGQVWSARSVPAGWSPYTTGRWNYEKTYGWTWVDEQPWGFAPYHYGRWAQRNDRWFWVPPERQQRAVYAPALVAFVGGTELGVAIGQQNRAPVGWFPLGPREAYVPSYTSNRDYYRRLNTSARVQQQVMDDRWQRAQRREAIPVNQQQFGLMNRRFATVVPAEDFARSRPVERVAIKVAPDKVASAPVAFLSAPPSPTQSIHAVRAQDNHAPNSVGRPGDGRPNDRDGWANAPIQAPGPGRAHVPDGPARFANMQAIKAEPEHEKAPGPKFVPRSAVTARAPDSARTPDSGRPPEAAKPGEPPRAADLGKATLPQLVPRNASAPPPAKIEGERKPIQGQQANVPARGPDGAGNRPGAPSSERTPQAGPPPRPGEANRPEPQRSEPPGQANLPPVRDRSEHRPEPPRNEVIRAEPQRPGEPGRPGEMPKPPQAQAAPQPHPVDAPKPPQAQAVPQPPRPGEALKPPQAQASPQHPAEAQKPPQAQASPQHPAEAQKPPQAQASPQHPAEAQKPPQAQASPQHPAEAQKPPQAQATPQPPRPVEATKPPVQAPPQASRPVEAPKPSQARVPPVQAPHQAAPPAPAPQRERETRAAPAPQPQHKAPPQQARAPAAAAPVQYAAPQQQVRAPAPVQRAAPPQQAHAPRPAPPPQQAPRPAPAPQQAQAPHPSPAPQHNQQAQAPAHNNEKK